MRVALCVLCKHFYCRMLALPLLLPPLAIYYIINGEQKRVLDECCLQGCAPWQPFPCIRCSCVRLALCFFCKHVCCGILALTLLLLPLAINISINIVGCRLFLWSCHLLQLIYIQWEAQECAGFLLSPWIGNLKGFYFTWVQLCKIGSLIVEQTFLL